MHQGGFRKSASASRLQDTYKPIFNHHRSPQIHSPHSSPSSTPQTLAAESTDLSFASTPASTVSDGDDTINPDSSDFHFPQYNFDVVGRHPHEDLEPPVSPPNGDSYTVSSNELESSTVASTPTSPDVVPKGFDDIAVQATPSHHVDYLSHNWREEDIWASWKYVTSNRGEYHNSERLENASWRTWMKSKNKLSTVSPEALNWLKDCDVTWLYGPLQRANGTSPTAQGTSSAISKSASFIDKKPILKKRSMSEAMLQQSLSAASLLKQATAAVQAQQNSAARRPILMRAHTDYPSFSLAPMSRQNSLAPSSDTSGTMSPNTERKHIHFNEQVEQCIAVDVKGEDDDGYNSSFVAGYDNYSSDEGIMINTGRRKKHPVRPRKSALKKNKSPEPKIIASLPSTTLKDRNESPEPRETAMKHSYRSPVISPSSSQETLKPSKKSTKFSFGSDSESDEESEEDDYDDEVPTPRVPSPSPRSLARTPFSGRSTGESTSAGPSEEYSSGSGMKRSVSTNSLGNEGSGMRRTSSGMLMPVEDELSEPNTSLFGRVIDTVNTARDIAHVIWNVGWRR
ncbi:uncharacterized protein MKZ38_002579 [Zalerion maritima]|uniref:Nitrogen regulatory protein areA GATA-like domain-containing protein n=1 Tax=Zalerion maritima TaxID=339359 RepID=A0AAD5RVJ0_9PEZI|nr:uncharacterized protein MKZ38_002579 [Zalerion maritima]